MELRYLVEMYSGRTYCGNMFCDTMEECIAYVEADEFCNKAKIKDLETGRVEIIRFEK